MSPGDANTCIHQQKLITALVTTRVIAWRHFWVRWYQTTVTAKLTAKVCPAEFWNCSTARKLFEVFLNKTL